MEETQSHTCLKKKRKRKHQNLYITSPYPWNSTEPNDDFGIFSPSRNDPAKCKMVSLSRPGPSVDDDGRTMCNGLARWFHWACLIGICHYMPSQVSVRKQSFLQHNCFIQHQPICHYHLIFLNCTCILNFSPKLFSPLFVFMLCDLQGWPKRDHIISNIITG